MTANETTLARVDDQAFVVDAAAIAIISVAISLISDELAVMTALVPAVLLVRFALWLRIDPDKRGGVAAELIFFGLCTAIGAFNDWSSVDRHRIYDYTAPRYFGDYSSIPLWMLLYWGMILRFLATLTRWQRLRPPPVPETRVWNAQSATIKVAVLLGLVVITRQLVYRFYADPVLSWLPFAVAIVVYIAVIRPSRHDWILAALFAAGGPLIEILYIQAGDLHAYQLGWLGGVPVWIALWWILAVLIWKDVSARLHLRLRRALP